MGGDGMNALAVLILGAMALMLLGGFAILFLIGRLIGRRMGLSPARRRLTSFGLGLLGLGLGALAVTATFFESTWAPPPALRFTVQPGFDHRWVVLLEDPSASNELPWRGVEMPFRGKTAAIAIPASGVLRVRAFGPMTGRGDTAISWSDGAPGTGMAAGPAPPGLRARYYMAFLRGDPVAATDDLPTGDPAALADYVRRREASR